LFFFYSVSSYIIRANSTSNTAQIFDAKLNPRKLLLVILVEQNELDFVHLSTLGNNIVGLLNESCLWFSLGRITSKNCADAIRPEVRRHLQSSGIQNNFIFLIASIYASKWYKIYQVVA
jgi:predicted transcriptional regulator with HTH domain